MVSNHSAFDVFLSHNSNDKPTVIRLGESLKGRGLRVWLDVWELVPGRPWQEALEEIVRNTKAALVLVGRDGIGPWQDREMRGCLTEFVDRQLPIIPVLLPDAPTEPELPIFLKQLTYVDLRDGVSTDGLDRIIWGITGVKPSSQAPLGEREGRSPYPEVAASIEVQDPSPHPATPSRAIAVTRYFAFLATIVLSIAIGVFLRVKFRPTITQPVETEGSSEVDQQEPANEQFRSTSGATLVWCPAGNFEMGPAPEAKRTNFDLDRRSVEIPEGFWVSKHEITQSQWQRIMNTSALEQVRKHWDGGHGVVDDPDMPIDWVSPKEIVLFCDFLTKIDREAGLIPPNFSYAIPTEIEWEYACRAGADTLYSFGNDASLLHKYGNFRDRRFNNPNYADPEYEEAQDDHYPGLAPVGQFLPNDWGLYDCHGNATEICLDEKGERVHRSGSFAEHKEYAYSHSRSYGGGGWDSGNGDCGFRIVCRSN